MLTRRHFLLNTALSSLGLALARGQAITYDDPWQTTYRQIIKRIKLPVFPSREYDITKFGAKPDGKANCRDAINRAIEVCSMAGGGTVLIPEGNFLTGAIRLKSNVNLHLSEGSRLTFSTDVMDYYPLVRTRWEGMELIHISPLIYAYRENNIAISGKGILDGQGSKLFWKWHGNPNYGGNPEVINQKADRAKLYKMMEDNLPIEKRVFGRGHFLRPQFIQTLECRNVLIEDITMIDSPMWEIHPVLCVNVMIRKVKIRSHGPNNDGCDPESCSDVLIEECEFDTGDDCIAIKSGRNNDGRRINRPSQNIIIRNCKMKDGHGGITIGSEISGGVRNVFAHDCLLDSPDLWTAIRIKNNASRGGRLEDLFFKNIIVGEVSRAAVEIDFNYEEGSKGNYTPVVKNLIVEGLKCTKSNRAFDLQGLDKAPIYDIKFKDCEFKNSQSENIVKNVIGLKLENVLINGKRIEFL
jgi:polygalacturonase